MAKKINTTKRTAIETIIDLEAGEMVIRLPLSLPPSPSASGKTLVIASSRGILPTAATYDGKPISIGVNAFIKK